MYWWNKIYDKKQRQLIDFQANYNTPATGKSLFNGNISQTLWKTANTDTSLKGYNYYYDALNRLINSFK